ncbi:MAG TPA: hypothetical protein VNX46_17835 [Candidatus Acidoferrum sp.]|jgi:hypothetical protein|nr:hypothetical protein [Candidatus Acidoferrum sp.]
MAWKKANMSLPTGLGFDWGPSTTKMSRLTALPEGLPPKVLPASCRKHYGAALANAMQFMNSLDKFHEN